MWPRRTAKVSQWALWQLSPQTRCYIFAVEALAAGCLVVLAAQTSWRPGDLVAAAVFVGCGSVSVEVFRRVGAPHRRRDRSYHDFLSAFLIPAVLVLPPLYAAVIPLAMHIIVQARVTPLAPVKRVYNAAVGVLICGGAALTYDALAKPLSRGGVPTLNTVHGVIALVLAAMVYLGLNKALMIGIIRRVAPGTPWRTLLGDAESWTMAVVDVCAGVGLAVVWVVSPALIGVALAPILLLQRSVVHTHLVAASRHDSKTGLANPSWWRHEAGRAVTRAQHGGAPLAVMIVDLDHFKAVNDRYGHVLGDAVLAAVADTLQVIVRPGDLVGRFGGDEFTVMLSGVDVAQAMATAERLRDRLATAMSHSIPGADPSVLVTASLGVAVFGHAGIELDELLMAADRAMYQAKALGGNTVYLAPGVRPPLPDHTLNSSNRVGADRLPRLPS